MLATAGWPAWWFAVTQSTPAMTPDVRAAAAAVEHPDGNQADALRDAVRRAADGAGDVRAVPVAVGRVAAGRDGVGADPRPPSRRARRG